MGEHDFLKLLTRVIKLYNDLRIYTTGYTKFSYDLEEKNGTLFLTVHFPSMGDAVTVSYNTKKYDDLYTKLENAEKYLQEKQVLTKRYI